MEFSDAVKAKAQRIVEAGGVRELAVDSWAVTSTSGETYLVSFNAWGQPQCSCPYGSHRLIAECSHVAAVTEQQQIAVVNPRWGDKQVDTFAVELKALRKLGHR
jgi:hypothetical protein